MKVDQSDFGSRPAVVKPKAHADWSNSFKTLTRNGPDSGGRTAPYLRLYVGDTASSTSDNLTPVKYPDPAPPAGTRLLDGWVPTFHGYGHKAQAVFECDTPWHADGQGQDLIYWQKQPGTLNDKVNVTWNDVNGHVYTVSWDLGQDRVITLAPTGVTLTSGQPAQATLPSLSLG